MCGIWGGVGLRLENPERVYAAALRHRGPDNQSAVRIPLDGRLLWMGHVRLAVIDTRAVANQPMWNHARDLCVVFNGEIYNFRELRRQHCPDYPFATSSDTEVLLALWERLGPKCLPLLRGMFAFAMHEVRSGKTYLCRDPFGIKPLYYATKSRDRLAFASEATALAWAEDLQELDRDALASYFWRRYVPGPAAVFKGVRKLPPASYASWEPGGELRITTYWLPPAAEERAGDLRETAARLRDCLADTVRAQLVSDVPLGIFVSGGVDSGMIAALAAPHLQGRFEAFSIGFDDPEFDEGDAAMETARACGATHHLIKFRGSLRDWLPRIAGALDEPLADPATLPMYVLSEFARRRVTVALSGDGADELFGGYKQYRLETVVPLLQPLRGAIRSACDVLGWNERRERIVRALGSAPADRGVEWTGVLSRQSVLQLLAVDPPAAERTSAVNGAAGLMSDDLVGSLPDRMLVKTDRMSMAHGLEVRVPFLDQEVADLACRLPLHYKVRPWADKIALREAARMTGPQTAHRRRKHGFNLPISSWLRGPDKDYCRDMLLDGSGALAGIASAPDVRRYFEEHTTGQRDHGLALFALLMLAAWVEASRKGPLVDS